ncbi:MAG: hypothetical protein FJX77_16805 [Armatimonadetes bacterium]|nr:hypothetical protein [Armatimonadota bacterium]
MDRTRASPRPLWPGVRPRPALAALALLLIGTLVWAAVTALLPGPNVSFAELSTAPPVAAAPGTEMLATPDPDRAAVWLSRRLGREIPPVNLSLVGAVCVGAVADQSARRGSFYYRTAEGSSLALHVLLARNPQLPALPTLHVEGAPFRVLEGSSGGPSGAVWQAEGHTYAALGRIPLSQLLVYVREMDRHCRERR